MQDKVTNLLPTTGFTVHFIAVHY